MNPRTHILITGATSGIGEACSRRLAGPGKVLMLNGRRKDRLDALCRELTAKHGCSCVPLPFDVRDRHAMANVLLEAGIERVDILINNAGLALGLDKLQDGRTEDWEAMIDTNIKGLLYLTRAVLPGMIERGYGHIINIGSIAGKEVYPGGVVYSATKFAVDALTRGLRMDLLPYGIRVTQIAPGAAQTEFSQVRFKGDDARALQVYAGFEPLRGEDIADIAAYIIDLPDRVNISDILIMPTSQASAMLIHRKAVE